MRRDGKDIRQVGTEQGKTREESRNRKNRTDKQKKKGGNHITMSSINKEQRCFLLSLIIIPNFLSII
jgi:hypothetical protein